MKYINHRLFCVKGMTLAEVMVAIAIVSIVSLGVAQLTSQITTTKKYLDVNQTLLVYQYEQIIISKNISAWLNKYRSKSLEFKNCFPEIIIDPATGLPENIDTRVFDCPATAALPPEVAAQIGDVATSFSFSSVPFYDIQGVLIAGTPAAPHYVNYDGSSCIVNCPIEVVNFVGRENSALNANPGQTISVISIKSNASYSGQSIPFKTKTLSFYIGNNWEKGVSPFEEDQSISGVCPEGTVVYGIDAKGKVLCRGGAGDCLPGTFVEGFDSATGDLKCKNFAPVTCTGNTYLYGIAADGSALCNNLPTPPSAPNVAPPAAPTLIEVRTCMSAKKGYTVCDIDPTATDVRLSNRYSKAKCDKGTGYGMVSPGKMYTNKGCRATFLISK